MSNGYLVAAQADIAAARELAEGFELELVELGALGGDAAISMLANADNVGVVLSAAGTREAGFYALVQTLGMRLPRAQLILVEPTARKQFGFLPESWPDMALDEARRRSNELKRRRETPPPESDAPRHAAPIEPSPPPEAQQQEQQQQQQEEARTHEAAASAGDEPEQAAPSAEDAAPESYEDAAAEAADALAAELDDVETPALPIPPMHVTPPPELGGEPPADVREEPPAPPAKVEAPVAPAAPETAADEAAIEPPQAGLFGDRYTQHYDASGEKVGRTRVNEEARPQTAPAPASSAPSPSFETQTNYSLGGARERSNASYSDGLRGNLAGSRTADASAFAPKKLRRETPELVRVVIYQPHQLKDVLKAAKKIDPRSEAAPQGMRVGDVALGETVGVSLDVRGAACDGAVQRRVWNGEPIDFSFTVEAEADVKQAVIVARVFVGDAQVGVIGFTRPISGAATKSAPGDRLKLKRHKRVFLSYSSQDRETVSAIATAYDAAGIAYFWDRSSLKSGEEWSPRLRKEIERADLFHLCWSKAAAKSEWVEKEAEHALTRRRRSNGKQPNITVQMLDGPPWAPHPYSLDSINFDDFVRAAVVGYARGDSDEAV